MTADPAQRFSGVGVAISTKVANKDCISYCTWIPGRLLQVRCSDGRVNLDVIAGYQWVRPKHEAAAVTERRSHFWAQLSRLLQSIPQGNLVVMGADLNKKRAEPPRFALREMPASVRNRDARAEELRAGVCHILSRASEHTTMAEVNSAVLRLCCKLYPNKPAPP